MQSFVLRSIFVLLFSIQLSLQSALAAEGLNPGSLPAPNWDRRLAMEVASAADTHQEADRLLSLATGGDSTAAIQAIRLVATRGDWSSPVREAILYEFTTRLQQLAPFSVNAEILDFLRHFNNQTLVAQEESYTTGVPLFPIRAAAAGLVNRWTQQQAEFEANDLISRNPEELLSVYAANPDINIRAGIEATVMNAPAASLLALLDLGMPLLADYPELTGLLGKAALASGDVQSVSIVFSHGSGHHLVELSRQIGQRFNAAELASVLLSSIESASPTTAAILIAELAPYCIAQDDVAVVLLNKLEDPNLGSTAALALARWGSEQQLDALKDLAARSPSDQAAKRAQAALSLQPSASRGGLPR